MKNEGLTHSAHFFRLKQLRTGHTICKRLVPELRGKMLRFLSKSGIWASIVAVGMGPVWFLKSNQCSDYFMVNTVTTDNNHCGHQAFTATSLFDLSSLLFSHEKSYRYEPLSCIRHVKTVIITMCCSLKRCCAIDLLKWSQSAPGLKRA